MSPLRGKLQVQLLAWFQSRRKILPSPLCPALAPSFVTLAQPAMEARAFLLLFGPKKKIPRKTTGLEEEFVRKAPLPPLELLIQCIDPRPRPGV